MSPLTASRFAAYAREQVHSASVVLAQHGMQGQVCRCGRLVPCPVAATAAKRRLHFAAALSRLHAAVGRARVHRPTSSSHPPTPDGGWHDGERGR